jgi:hypothetical protein
MSSHLQGERSSLPPACNPARAIYINLVRIAHSPRSCFRFCPPAPGSPRGSTAS